MWRMATMPPTESDSTTSTGCAGVEACARWPLPMHTDTWLTGLS